MYWEPWTEEFISYRDGVYHIDQAASPTLFRMLLVCRHWREAALGCSILWSDNPTFDPPPAFFDFMLQYSRTSSLWLGWIMIPSDKDERMLAKLLTVLHRVRILTLTVRDTDLDPANTTFDQIMVGLHDSPIRYLKIRFISGIDLDKAKLLSLPATLTSLILENLSLSDSLQTPHLNLTSLMISNLPSPWQCHLPGAFLDALAHLTKLQSLEIGYAVGCPVPRVCPAPTSQPVHLPELIRLAFRGTPAHFAYMHASLLPSPTASYWIIFRDTADYDDDTVPPGWVAPPYQSAPHTMNFGTRSHELGLAFSELKRHLDHRLSDAIAQGWYEQFRLDCTLHRLHGCLYLVLSPLADSAGGIHRYRFIHPLNADEGTGPGIFFVTWEVAEYTSTDVDDYGPYTFIRDKIFPFLTGFCSIFPADAVAHLYIGMDAPTLTLGSSQWRPSFLDWTALQTLHVEGAGLAALMAPYLSYMDIPVDVTAQPTKTLSVVPSFFPSLKTLILDKINKSSLRDDHDWSGQAHSNKSIIDQWNRVLRARMTSQQPLEKLGLIEGGGARLWRRWLQNESQSAWLRGCDVRWTKDGRRGGYETPDDMSDHSEAEEDGWIARVYSDIGYWPLVESSFVV